MYIMTLYAVFGIGYSLAKSYDLDGLSGAIMAELTFLLTIVPVSIPDVTDSITALASKNAELNAFFTTTSFRICYSCRKLRISRYVYWNFICIYWS